LVTISYSFDDAHVPS